MKKLRNAVALIMVLFLFACSNKIDSFKVDTQPIKVEDMSVQELDDFEVIKPNTTKPNDLAIKKYQIINKYFKTMTTPGVCDRLDAVETDNYAIINSTRKKTNYYTIYKKGVNDKEEPTCQEIKMVKNSTAYKAAEFNGKLYLAVDNYIFSKKQSLMEFDGKSVKTIKLEVNEITNLINTNNYLLFVNGMRIDAVAKDGKLINVKNDDKNNSIHLAFKSENNLNVVYKNKKNAKYTIVTYDLGSLEGKALTKLSDMRVVAKKVFDFGTNETVDIKQIITDENDKYVVLGDRLVCVKDMSICRYTQIDGESIYGLDNEMVLYMSDRFYVSDFELNKKQVISSNPTPYMEIRDNIMYFMFTDVKTGDSVYVKYEIEKEYDQE